MRNLSGTICGSLAATASIAIVSPAAFAQEGRPIAEIEVRGTKNTNADVVRLAARGVGIREGSPFSSDAFTKAKQAIEKKGLYSSVYARAEDAADGRRVRIVFEIVENPVINAISLSGVRSLKPQDILPTLKTKPGDVLNRPILDEDILRIQRLYADRGYRVFVAEEFEYDAKTGVLTIPIVESVVESIEVEGLHKTKLPVVLRELRTKVGEVYNADLVQEDLSRLLALNIFQDAVALPPQVGSDLGKTKVVIQVQEQRTGQVGVSVGYSVQQRLTGTVSLDESNFRGRAQGLNVSWTVSGGISRNSYELSFSEPWVDKHNTSLGVSVYDRFAFRFNRIFSTSATSGTSNDQYYEERKGGAVRLSRPLTADRFTRAFTSVRAETIRANNLQQNYDTLTDEEINNLRGSLVQNGNVTAIGGGILENRVDNAQDPSRGFYFSPSFEVGGATFDYQRPRINPAYAADPTQPRVLVDGRSERGAFAKYGLDVRRYTSLNGQRAPGNLREPKRVLATRLLVGSARGTIPFSEQYFMGGADNLRGYFDDRFWGNNQLLLSNELRIPLDKGGQLGGVAFLDIGDAWGASGVNGDDIPGFEQHRNFKPRMGYGIGIRVKTPVGPVRLDLGFGDGRSPRSHFSIGQAF